MKTFKALLMLMVLFFCSFPVISQNNGSDTEITKVEIEEMVEKLCQLIMDHYVFPDVAKKICDTLHHNLEKGEYNVKTVDALSVLLSRDLKSVNQDIHLNAWSFPPDRYNQNTEKVDPIVRQLHIIRKNAERSFDFKKVEILEGNIGYLELTKFKSIPDPRLERVLEGAMNFLSCCSAIILDLRRNTGGNFRMIQKFMSYFFKKSVQLTGSYTRDSGGVMELYTRDNFSHQHLVDIPLFVLVSSRTISGPEMVAYDLQVLNRAVIIGEKTKGAANPSRFHRIKEKLLVCIPYGYAVNSITQSNWEGTGVTPDVMVPADSPLTTAIGLAKEAAEKVKKREQDKVDRLVVTLGEKMRQFEEMLKNDVIQAENLFNKILNEFYQIEYMNKYLLLDWLESYKTIGNLSACEIISKQGINRYPEEHRFYTWLGDLYYNKGDIENALKTYSALLRLNSNDISVKNKIKDIHKKLQNQ